MASIPAPRGFPGRHLGDSPIGTGSTLPSLAFSMPGGAIADIMDRRKLLLGPRAWMLIVAWDESVSILDRILEELGSLEPRPVSGHAGCIAAESSPVLSKDQTLGKYQILDRLGSGGFGAVYLAMDTWVNRKVALKVPHQQQDEIVDLLKEPRIMAGLKHPNIVELITVERKNGIFFMVLEYVEGESLDRMIRRERALAPTRALEIGIDVCSAIAFAHGHQILHRDLRPANILVNREGVAKVTDFGTSRVLELQHVPYAPTRIGSPPYMAPEHFRGRAVFQSDLWSLGITLYEMLTGTVPFYDADPLKIAQALTSQEITPPHQRNPIVPKTFSEVVMKALAVNLGERYLSAQAFLEGLRRLKDSVARETRPLGTAILSTSTSGPHPALRSASTQGRFCPFCYCPLPRMATRCPRCSEKIPDR